MHRTHLILLTCLVSGAANAAGKAKLSDHPHDYILRAPKNVDRWEPSAAIIEGDRLWVASDKPIEAGDTTWGVLAAYDLKTLMSWTEARAACTDTGDLKKGKCDDNKPVDVRLIRSGSKLEAAAAGPRGHTTWWNTRGNHTLLCPDAGGPCLVDAIVGLPDDDDLRAVVSAHAKDAPLSFVTVEGFAMQGTSAWVGIRKYKPKSGSSVMWTAILDEDATPVWGGGLLQDETGRAFAVSDLLASGDGLWVTLSHETDEEDRASVDGKLAFLLGDTLTDCGDVGIVGKPEAVASWEQKLLLVYDNDKDRKTGGPAKKGDGFPLRSDQDYLQILSSAPRCDGAVLTVGTP